MFLVHPTHKLRQWHSCKGFGHLRSLVSLQNKAIFRNCVTVNCIQHIFMCIYNTNIALVSLYIWHGKSVERTWFYIGSYDTMWHKIHSTIGIKITALLYVHIWENWFKMRCRAFFVLFSVSLWILWKKKETLQTNVEMNRQSLMLPVQWQKHTAIRRKRIWRNNVRSVIEWICGSFAPVPSAHIFSFFSSKRYKRNNK